MCRHFHTNGGVSEHDGGIQRMYSLIPLLHVSFFPHPFLGTRSRHLLPQRFQQKVAGIPQINHLWPGNNESEHVTGAVRKPAAYPIYNSDAFHFPEREYVNLGKTSIPSLGTCRGYHPPPATAGVYSYQTRMTTPPHCVLTPTAVDPFPGDKINVSPLRSLSAGQV